MKTVKKVLNHIFIEGLSGMAMGLFATLIVGTIIQQVGNLIGGQAGEMLFFLGKMAAAMTSAGIGVGVAHRFKESPLVTVSAATAGMVGGFASKILAGSVLVDGTIVLAGPGEPLGAFLAAYVAIVLGHLVSGKTKVDILVTPVVSILAGSAAGLLVGPPISRFMVWLGSIINWGTEQQPLPYGNYRFRAHGNDPDSAHQFGGSWGHPESLRTGGGSGDHRLLLQYGRFCGGKLPGK